MKSLNETDMDVALVKTAGMALFTFALIKLPSAIASLVGVISTYLFLTSSMGREHMRYISQLNLSLISHAVGELILFALLLCLARWVFCYPAILRKWLNKSEHRLKD